MFLHAFLVCECVWACDRLRSQWCQQQMRGRRFVAVCHNEVRSDQNISPEAAIYSICLSQTTSAPKLWVFNITLPVKSFRTTKFFQLFIVIQVIPVQWTACNGKKEGGELREVKKKPKTKKRNYTSEFYKKAVFTKFLTILKNHLNNVLQELRLIKPWRLVLLIPTSATVMEELWRTFDL